MNVTKALAPPTRQCGQKVAVRLRVRLVHDSEADADVDGKREGGIISVDARHCGASVAC
jgi:hypothetical protein